MNAEEVITSDETTPDEHGVFDAPEAPVEETQQAQETAEVSEQPSVQREEVTEVAPTTVSPEAIAEAVAKGMRESQSQQQAAPAPLSEEEIQKRLKVHKFDEGFAEALISEIQAENPDPKAVTALLNQMHEKQMQQAQTYAYYMNEMNKQQLQQQYQPVLTHYEQQQREASQKAFIKSYPALEPFKQVLPDIATKLQASGAQYKTQEEAFKALAEAAEATIKTFNPGFALGEKQQAQKKGPAPNVTTMGGQGGGGGGSPVTKTRGSADIW